MRSQPLTVAFQGNANSNAVDLFDIALSDRERCSPRSRIGGETRVLDGSCSSTVKRMPTLLGSTTARLMSERMLRWVFISFFGHGAIPQSSNEFLVRVGSNDLLELTSIVLYEADAVHDDIVDLPTRFL